MHGLYQETMQIAEEVGDREPRRDWFCSRVTQKITRGNLIVIWIWGYPHSLMKACEYQHDRHARQLMRHCLP